MIRPVLRVGIVSVVTRYSYSYDRNYLVKGENNK